MGQKRLIDSWSAAKYSDNVVVEYTFNGQKDGDFTDAKTLATKAIVRKLRFL
jgi:hypothetical protein